MRRTYVLVFALLLVGVVAVPASGRGASVHVTGRLLVPPAPLTGGAYGMDVAPDGSLWVGNIGSRQVSQLDPDSGRLLARFGPDQGVEGADDVAVGSDGSVYYTAILTGEVGRIHPDGTHETVANCGFGVNPITYVDDGDGGRLFVGKSFLGPTGLWELDPAGDACTADNLIRADSNVNGFDWWDGHLYGPDPTTGQVFRIDVDTGVFTEVVSGLGTPGAVDIAPDGSMFVLDLASDEVLGFDPVTGETWHVATAPGSDNMAIDADGRLFVSGGIESGVYRVLPNGSTVTVSPGGLAGPMGLAAVEGSGNHDRVYASDLFAVYGYDGRTGQQQLEVDALPLPQTLAADGDDLVFASWFSNVVGVWNPASPGPDAVYPTFATPLNAIRFGGDLVVSELGTGSVVSFDPTTNTRQTLVSAPHVFVPTGLAATDDDLWVADWATGTVLQLVRDGAVLATPVTVAAGLAQPEGMALTRDGDLLVIEAGARRLSLIDLAAPAPTTARPLVEGLALGQPAPPGMPPTWSFDDVTVGPSGAVYVSATGIHRYELHP